MRLGRNLKDRCIKSDPEQGMLINMLEELKNKWNILRSIVAQRYVIGSLKSWTVMLLKCMCE